MKPTNEQRLTWLKEKRCHVCGSNTAHTHPNWMWLANPPPTSDDPEIKERVAFEDEINKTILKNIVG